MEKKILFAAKTEGKREKKKRAGCFWYCEKIATHICPESRDVPLLANAKSRESLREPIVNRFFVRELLNSRSFRAV
jgi:hypothetical protein